MKRLALVGLGLALGGCISKSTYLAKVDEAVRYRGRAEICEKRMRELGDLKADLEEQIRGAIRQRKVVQLERDACNEKLPPKEEEIAKLKDELRKTSDMVNELRAQLATATEQSRGAERRLAEIRAEEERKRRARRKEPDLSDVSEALKNELGATAGLVLQKQLGAMVLRIPHTLLFRRRTPVLTRDGRELCGRLADALARLPNRAFRVLGHQDSQRVPRRLRSPSELSLLQAVEVGKELIRSGMDPGRVTVTGVGASRPLVSGETPEAREQNRRIEIVITPLGPLDTHEVIGPSAT